ncbi:hypothetical protein LCGC14_2531790, partial [marine sediment metagenome]
YSCMQWVRHQQVYTHDIEIDNRIVLEYTPCRVTKPKFGKILAFANLTDANSFMWREHLLEVWRCSTPAFKHIRLLAVNVYVLLGNYERYWLNPDSVFTMTAPHGTVACPQVCLKELMIRNG